MWSITVDKGLEGARVRIRGTGQLGTIKYVCPGSDGKPWSLAVKLDDQAHDAPPVIYPPGDVSRVDLVN